MTTPQTPVQLPPLPPIIEEPVGWRHSLTYTLHETEQQVQLADAGSEAEPLFTADQMREYAHAALEAQKAEPSALLLAATQALQTLEAATSFTSKKARDTYQVVVMNLRAAIAAAHKEWTAS